MKNLKGQDELIEILWTQAPHQQEKLGRCTGSKNFELCFPMGLIITGDEPKTAETHVNVSTKFMVSLSKK